MIMSLSTISVPTKHVPVGDDGFEVTGLTLTTLAELMKENEDLVAEIFSGNAKVENLINAAPDAVASVIATCAGEPDQVGKVKKLPTGVQLIAISSVIELTVVDWDEAGKLLGSLMENFTRVSESVQEAAPKVEQS